MEDDLGHFHQEGGALHRELNSLVPEMEHEEAVRPDLAIPACSRAAFTFAPINSTGNARRVDLTTAEAAILHENLYFEVAGGTYVQPWYHGIENLRKDHRGYVYWKGVQVDHYSFEKYEDAHEAALELADRCRTLEMLGVPVSTAHQAWWYDELVSAVTAN